MEHAKLHHQIHGGILGLAVGDALGVPVEFKSREYLHKKPVTDMQGHGTHDQPPGTWSDDTSLTLCLLDSLATKGLKGIGKFEEPTPQPFYDDIMKRFLSWLDEGKYTPHGNVFDVGVATRKALQKFRNGKKPLECGGKNEQDNGNGSLMRILPMVLYFPVIDKLYHGGGPSSCRETYVFLSHYIHPISSLTHAHNRSLVACGIYATIGRMILDQSYLKEMDVCGYGCRYGYAVEPTTLKDAVFDGLKESKALYQFLDGDDDKFSHEISHFERLFKKSFARLPKKEIKSSGYVVDTLEAALWCLLNTANYRDCVLKAVNLGDDTDTVAAVAGGLAGMFYGVEDIPPAWLQKLARREYIEGLCETFYRSLWR